MCRKKFNGDVGNKMENEQTENANESQTAPENVVPAVGIPAENNSLSELDAPIWSVISFEKRVGKNLNYADAAAMLKKLIGAKVSGLCIITDEAAEKMSGE